MLLNYEYGNLLKINIKGSMNSDYQSLTWRQMAEYHEELRKEIFDRVEQKYKHFGVQAREISFKDTTEADSWKKIWQKPNRKASWSWSELYQEYHSRGGARRFDMAISKGSSLISLCYGMMERNRVVLKLHAIEHAPP